MSAQADRMIELLEAIDRKLGLLVKQQAAAKAAEPPRVATGKDLDGKFGDPVLRFTVRNWTGPSYKGRPFSQCPPELLDMIAESLEYFARKDDEEGALTSGGKPKSDYRRNDAARARGWAARKRAGHMTTTHETPVAMPKFVGEGDTEVDTPDDFATAEDGFGEDDSFT